MDHGLTVRQHLKESFRAQLRKETPSGATDHDTNLNTAYQGNFFGHSETVISDRVMALLRNKNLLWKNKSTNPYTKSWSSSFVDESTKVETKSNKTGKENKLKFIREARDYSFLLAGTAGSDQVPGPEPKARNNSRPEDKARIISRPGDKARNISRPEEPGKKTNNSRAKSDGKAMVRKAPVSKQSQSGMKKSCSKADHALKRKQEERDDKEEVNAIRMIRGMFRYDPTKYADDRDDLRMEASFRDIEKEERRSAKIARKEDAEELRKLSVKNSKKRTDLS